MGIFFIRIKFRKLFPTVFRPESIVVADEVAVQHGAGALTVTDTTDAAGLS